MNNFFTRQVLYTLIVGSSLLLLSCTKDKELKNTFQAESSNDWLVPFENILYWGDPTDEILSIENPQFISIQESDLLPEDRVFVFSYNDKIKVYPIAILGLHEIINDQIDDLSFAVNYCPITQSGMNWNRFINGSITEFGVSGLLYNDNLIPYDRNTKSYWSQMLNLCINGKLIGDRPELLILIECDFGLLSSYFPEARVLIEPEKMFADQFVKNQSATKTLLGIAGSDRALLFSYADFENGITVYNTVLNSRFLSSKVVVVGSAELDFMIAFENHGYPQITFSAVGDDLPVLMQDNLGNHYNLLGKAVSGPDIGKQLPAARAYRALEFAWNSMFETLIYFGEE